MSRLKYSLYKNINTSMDQNITHGFDTDLFFMKLSLLFSVNDFFSTILFSGHVGK